MLISSQLTTHDDRSGTLMDDDIQLLVDELSRHTDVTELKCVRRASACRPNAALH